MSNPNALSQAFDNLKHLFEAQELAGLLKPFALAATNFAGNPTAINGVAQLASLQAAVLAVQPGIVQSALQGLAGVVAAAAQNAAAKEAAAVSAAVPKAPAAPPPA